jgi:hypothetical protein
MHANVNVVPRKPALLRDAQREFIQAVASEVCAGIRTAMGGLLQEMESILHSADPDQEKIARMARLVASKRPCRRLPQPASVPEGDAATAVGLR